MFEYIDTSFISEWLIRSYASVNDIQSWWLNNDNAIHFSHFWLSDFPDERRQEIMELEINLLKEELKLGFEKGLHNGAVHERDFAKVLRAVLREYPKDFGGDGSGLGFLDLVRNIAGGKTERYVQLLSAVKCSTENTVFIEYLLAIRSFCLVSLVSAIIMFYRKLKDLNAK